MALDETKLDQLIEIGRRDGRITLAQMAGVLPISSMSPSQIAEAVDRLESAGITVDIDEPWATAPRSDTPLGSSEPVDIAHPAPPADPGKPASPAWKAAAGRGEPTTGTAPASHGPSPSWRKAGVELLPVAAVVGAVVLLLLVLFLLV